MEFDVLIRGGMVFDGTGNRLVRDQHALRCRTARRPGLPAPGRSVDDDEVLRGGRGAVCREDNAAKHRLRAYVHQLKGP